MSGEVSQIDPYLRRSNLPWSFFSWWSFKKTCLAWQVQLVLGADGKRGQCVDVCIDLMHLSEWVLEQASISTHSHFFSSYSLSPAFCQNGHYRNWTHLLQTPSTRLARWAWSTKHTKCDFGRQQAHPIHGHPWHPLQPWACHSDAPSFDGNAWDFEAWRASTDEVDEPTKFTWSPKISFICERKVSWRSKQLPKNYAGRVGRMERMEWKERMERMERMKRIDETSYRHHAKCDEISTMCSQHFLDC